MIGGPSQYELALRLYASGNPAAGLEALGRSARAGFRPALTELGARLCVGAGAPLSPVEGDGLLTIAATAGDALALRYRALVVAGGLIRSADWHEARRLLADAAAAGDQQSIADLGWFDQLYGRTLPHIEWHSDRPRVGIVPGFMPAGLCRWVINEAPAEMAPAEVTDGATGRPMVDPARTNRMAQVRLFDMPIAVLWLRSEMALLSGTDVTGFEIMNLLRYEPGQEFRRHHDYLDPERPGFADELKKCGQRVATFLVYLNDDFAGGETEFPGADLRLRGHAGDGLLFFNVDRRGVVDRRSEHSGLPPVAGIKWLLSQWIRDRSQPVR